MAEADVEVKYGADIKGLDEGNARALRTVEGFVNKVEDLGQKVKGAAIFEISKEVIEGTIRAVKDFSLAMGELGNRIDDTSHILGMSVEDVTKLQYIAEASGGTLEQMSQGLERLAANAQRAASGSKNEEDAFRRLGVNVRDARGNLKDFHTMMLEVADSFAKHADGPEKTALAMQLLGRAGVQLIPVLDQGRDGLLRLEQTAMDTGSVLSEDTVAGMTMMKDKATELDASMRGLGVALFNVFGPGIRGLTDQIINLVQNFTNWTTESYNTNGAMRVLAFGFDVVVAGINTLIEAFQLLWEVASAILNSLGDALDDIGAGLAYALSGNFAEAASYGQKLASDLTRNFTQAGDAMGKSLNRYKDGIKEMFAETTSGMNNITIGGDGVGGGGGGGGGGAKPSYSAPGNFQAMNKALDQLKAKVQDVQNTFKSLFSSIISGADRAFTGLMTGTMTWQQAMFTVLDSIWSSIVKLLEDWLTQWLSNEATMLLVHQDANAAKIASDQAAQSMGAADMIMNAIQSIFTSSKTTAAGVTANLAPTMGPAAIPAGLAAGAAVAGLASFDTGAWNVPGDMVAQIHKGEVVVPSKGGIADEFRSMMGGGGGDTYNFNGPVMDKASLVRALNEFQAQNPKSRGKF